MLLALGNAAHFLGDHAQTRKFKLRDGFKSRRRLGANPLRNMRVQMPGATLLMIVRRDNCPSCWKKIPRGLRGWRGHARRVGT